ncbi:MAG: hypothetical protein ACRDQZ_01015 [Mycobacteriales bacterium]
MLLAAVGHTAVHVADSSDVVLVVAAVVVVVDDVEEGLLLQPIITRENAAKRAGNTARRFNMISVFL